MNKQAKLAKRSKEEEARLAPIYDAAVKHINQLADSAASSQEKIGAYLLDKFFEGDLKAAKDRASNKGLSLRKLALHPEIDCSYSTLSRSLDVGMMREEFKTVATLQQLSASHLVTLAAVEDQAQRKVYAEKAIRKELSSRKLKELLVADGLVAVRGRGALTVGWEKDLADHRLLGVYRACAAISQIELEDSSTVSKSAAKKALEEAEAARESLGKLIKKLKEKAEE